MFTNEVTSMEQHGFIQDMLDVKVLILFVMAKLSYPVTLQTIYELCYQDDKLSYFDVSVAVPQMVQSGHLQQLPDDTYVITDKGREHEEITCDAIAYPVMQRALMAVQRYNTRIQRKGLIETKIEQEETGDYLAQLCLRDDAGVLMKLELAAPTLSQARTLVRAYENRRTRSISSFCASCSTKRRAAMRSFKAAPEVLSAWMDERKLTAAELSRQTGIDAGILRKIMTGRETAVSTRNLMTLARYFGLSMQELIDAFSGQ